MTKAILDSNFLIALIDEKDKWRKTAISIQKVLKKKKARVCLGLAEDRAGNPNRKH